MVGRAVEGAQNGAGLGLVSNLDFFAEARHEVGGKRSGLSVASRFARALEKRRNRPIFPWYKGFDFALAIDDEFDCDGLHATGREPAAHFRP